MQGPELGIPIGKVYKCVDGKRWIFLGNQPTSINTEMCFICVSNLNINDPLFYKVVRGKNAIAKFPALGELSTDPADHKDPDPCPKCGLQLIAKWNSYGCDREGGCGFQHVMF